MAAASRNQHVMINAARDSWILFAVAIAVLGTTSVARGQSAQTVQQVRVQWTTPVPGVAPPPGQRANPLRVLERRSVAGSLPRQRNPQMSADHLVVQAFNAGGVLVDSHLILDPRLVRAELPTPSGELTGQVLERIDPDFLITIPDRPDLVELRLFKPRWTGTAFVLDPIGTIDLR